MSDHGSPIGWSGLLFVRGRKRRHCLLSPVGSLSSGPLGHSCKPIRGSGQAVWPVLLLHPTVASKGPSPSRSLYLWGETGDASGTDGKICLLWNSVWRVKSQDRVSVQRESCFWGRLQQFRVVMGHLYNMSQHQKSCEGLSGHFYQH